MLQISQDSLGGNTKTLMVACLSPADNNYDETLSTLRYANRAKNIKNKPKINEDPKDAMLREYQEEIQKLKDLLEKQPQGSVPGARAYLQSQYRCLLYIVSNLRDLQQTAWTALVYFLDAVKQF